MGGTATAPQQPGAAAAAADPHAHDAHHAAPKLEEFFEAVVAPGVGALPEGEHPLQAGFDINSTLVAGGASTSAGAMGAGAGLDSRYGWLVAELQASRNYSAVLAVTSSDAVSFSLLAVADGVVRSAPKRSPLHALRLAAVIHQPEWAQPMQDMGAVALMPQLLALTFASKLLTAPLGKPLVTHKAQSLANNDEMARTIYKGSVEGPHFWASLVQGAGAAEGDAAAAVTAVRAASHAAEAVQNQAGILRRKYAGGSAAATGGRAAAVEAARTMGTAAASAGADSARGGEGAAGGLGKGGVMAAMMLGAEDVPEWQRESYLNDIQELGEGNTAADLDKLGLGGKLRKQDELEMFGSVLTEQEAEQEGAEGAEEARGSAWQTSGSVRAGGNLY